MRQWLAADEAAVWLGVRPDNLWQIAHRDEWRRLKRGRRVYYWLDDVGRTVERRGCLTSGVRSRNLTSEDV